MSNISVIMPTSPNQFHPSTEITEETIKSVRHFLPDAEIILTFDGVRKEQKDYTEAYSEYKQQMLWKCLHTYTNVLPIVFEKHEHQSGMLHESIKEVKTPLLMYVEHDAPLRSDRKIPFGEIEKMILDGKANTIRLHHEEILPREHEDLYIGGAVKSFRKTIQWSQRPHISSVLYYKDLLKEFPREWRTMIEDVWHGVVDNDYKQNGKMGWFKHRLWVYYPDNGLQRSYHLDARGQDKKYEMFLGNKPWHRKGKNE